MHTLRGKTYFSINNMINQLYIQQYSRKLSLYISFYEEGWKTKCCLCNQCQFCLRWDMFTCMINDNTPMRYQNCVTAVSAKKEVCVNLPVDSVIMLITYSINGLSKHHEANEGPLKGRHSCCIITQKCVMWQCAMCDYICQTDKLCWQRGAAVTNPSSLEGINRQK